jgi:hypothetical protein
MLLLPEEKHLFHYKKKSEINNRVISDNMYIIDQNFIGAVDLNAMSEAVNSINSCPSM